MNPIQILELLSEIKSDGTYISHGSADFVLPGLNINGFGELALPVTELQAQNLIKVAHKAPFGKGSQTIVDEKVRNTWEIDAANLTFKNPQWDTWLQEILVKIKMDLGIDAKNISASLYKMLLYEKGDFFTWHKDSEKEKNMFASLVITLPSAHEGGELAVRFQGEETVVDSAKSAENYQYSYAAFYADCEHEVRPLLSGYRICLVYNLLQSSRTKKLSATDFGLQVEELTDMLKKWQLSFGNEPQAILLNHQYTPASFERDTLKLDDKPRAQVLLRAARKAGFYARLALVTHYRMGELQEKYSSRRRYSRYDDDGYNDDVDGTMGEIHEEYTTIEYWAEEELPDFDSITITGKNIVSHQALAEDEPIEKEAEGFTGNAGMTMEHWYHYGAVVLWTEAIHEELLAKLSLAQRLVWLSYYAENNEIEPKAKHFMKILLANINEIKPNTYLQKDTNASGLAAAWTVLNDKNAFKADGLKLVSLFSKISKESWADLIETYPADAIEPLFFEVSEEEKIEQISYWIDLLLFLVEKGVQTEFIQKEIQKVPLYLTKIDRFIRLPERELHYGEREQNKANRPFLRQIITGLLKMSEYSFLRSSWNEDIAKLFTAFRGRDYVNEVLGSVLLIEKEHKKSALFQQIQSVCVSELEARTAVKPQPLPDWRRELPDTKSNKAVWDMLSSFLLSPTEYIYEYRKKEGERRIVEGAIQSVTIDLETETVRKGTPHTLVIKKNKAAYKKKLKEWDVDCDLLTALGE